MRGVYIKIHNSFGKHSGRLRTKMSRVAVSSIFIVAVAVTAANAALIPVPDISGLIPSLPTTLVPLPTLRDVLAKPQSKGQAIGLIRKGCGMGKRAINLRINAAIESSNNDPTLTPASRKCIVEKAEVLREQTHHTIDDEGNDIVEEIEEAPVSWLPVWIEVLSDLPTLIWRIVTDCRQSLIANRAECIAQTATS